MKSGAARSPDRSGWPRSFSIPTICPMGSTISKVLQAPARESLCEIIFAKALSVSIVFASVEEIDALQHSRRRATRHGASGRRLERASALCPDRRPRPAGWPHLPGAPDHRRGRSLDVDRRRLDCRQDNAGRADAQSWARIPTIWLRRACRLCYRRASSSFGLGGPMPLSPALVSTWAGRSNDPRPKKVSKGLKPNIL